ncbi:hypothetical protein Aperf_G00000046523 [Anoplocephala perfoliata]
MKSLRKNSFAVKNAAIKVSATFRFVVKLLPDNSLSILPGIPDKKRKSEILSKGTNSSENSVDLRKSPLSLLCKDPRDGTCHFTKSTTSYPKVATLYLRYANRAPESTSLFQGDNFEGRVTAAIKEEEAIIRAGLGHGKVSGEAYSRVWEECLSQVLHLSQHHHFTRANLVPKQERLNAVEKRLEVLRCLMADEAKKAAREEEKLAILLSEY